MEGEDEEDDIWDQKSLKQLKRKLENSTCRNKKSTTLPCKNAKSKRTTSTVNKPQRSGHLGTLQETKQDNSQTSIKDIVNKQMGKQKRKREDSASSSSSRKELDNEDSRINHQLRNQCDSPVLHDKITPKKNITDGYCPKCQMPFTALVGQSPEWHVSECLGIKYSYIGMVH